MSTATQAPRAVGLRGLLSVAAVGLVLVAVLTSPEPPDPDQGWRWATVGLGLTTCAWNVTGVAAAFRRTGPVSLVAFFYLWLFLAFSLPITEAAYRYDVVSLGYWGIATDDPLLFRAAVLLVIFQVTCGCSMPGPLPPGATYLGLPATVYHLAGVYLGGALVAVAAFSRRL